MKPYIILHNSITLDGSLTGFMPDMELHYRLAGNFSADATLIGSATVITGQEMFGEGSIPPEEPGDFLEPVRSHNLPWWIIVDSGGKLRGMLHTCRRFEYCRDLILLVSDATPTDYLMHLDERKIRYIKTGSQKADMKSALSILNIEYGIKRIMTDTGQVLGNLLLNEGLVDEISLLIHPLIKGDESYPVFKSVSSEIVLKLLNEEKFENGCVWLNYKLEQA